MLQSKLPSVGTTIFSQMSALATKHHAINLSQGFPEFDGPNYLKQQTQHYIETGFNQYAPMQGILALREQISALVKNLYQRDICPEDNVTITSGATEAIFVAIQSIIFSGDEVIVFDPAYDSYAPAIAMAGGKAIHLPLHAPSFSIDWQLVQNAITNKTKAIIINCPHNPTATCLNQDDLLTLQAIAEQHNLFVISDEVYEHLILNDAKQLSINCYPALAERSFIISSFGKTFHMTGWKIGYCVAPKHLMAEFRKVHQYVTFSTFTPAQLALADMLAKEPNYCHSLAPFFKQKSALFCQALSPSKFTLLPNQGSYFVLADYSQISQDDDVSFCHWLTVNHGVAAIPLSVFYQQPQKQHLIRFCFAKHDSTLTTAAQKLCQL